MTVLKQIGNFINRNLAAKPAATAADFSKAKKILPHIDKPIARVREDIKKWNTAQNLYNAEEAKNYLLQLLYKEIGIDALLTSQLQNRLQQSLAVPFILTNDKGEKDEEQTTKLLISNVPYDLITAIWEKRLYGVSLVEILMAGDAIKIDKLPRTNIVQQKGLYYPDYMEDTSIPYRTLKEYGKWILEFNNGDMGLLNKAVPHVLFKRFAQSCWSELCEIYGIPPRVLKTNTGDPKQLSRADKMMRDMAAAAYFIIDTEESFEWAKAADTNGDVYKSLIGLCNNEISLLLSGAIIGQDTLHGSKGKEQSSQEQLALLVKSDLAMVEQEWNSTVIPALVAIGYLKGTPKFTYDKVDDIKELWAITKEALPYYNVDAEWVKAKFGVEIIGERAAPVASGDGAKLSENIAGFFM